MRGLCEKIARSNIRAENKWLLTKPTWKRKLLQAASILRHNDGDYKSQLLIEIEESSLCMVLIGPPMIEERTVACPAAGTTGVWEVFFFS